MGRGRSGKNSPKRVLKDSGFTPSENYSMKRALRTYQNAIDAGFDRWGALDAVKAAQWQVEQMAKGRKAARDVTSSTYERAQRRLRKRVDDWFGRR